MTPNPKHKRITFNRNSVAWENLVTEVWERDNHTCQGCAKYLQRNEIAAHHVKTVGSGGDDVLDNLTSLCKSCHLKIDSGELIIKKRETGK